MGCGKEVWLGTLVVRALDMRVEIGL